MSNGVVANNLDCCIVRKQVVLLRLRSDKYTWNRYINIYAPNNVLIITTAVHL